MTARGDFLEAWAQWDHAAGKMSESFGASAESLRVVTNTMMEKRAIYATELGIESLMFSRLLTVWRQAGRNYERALAAVEVGLKE